MYRFDDGLAPYVGTFPDADLDDLAATRQRVDAVIAERQRSIDWSGVDVASAQAGSVPVTIYRPTGATAPLPALVWFHGGGFVLADERSDDPLLSHLVRALGIAVVSVRYRLAPEHPCPAALDDGIEALRWCAAEANELGIDPDRLALGGDSAGACLPAGVALARPDAEPSLRLLHLGEPVLDARLETPSMGAMVDTPVWRRGDAERSWELYLGGCTLDQMPSYACPATSEGIDRLPPTSITANAIDPLRDEAIDFARRLLEAGVPVELHVYPGAFHGAMSFPSPLADRMRLDLVENLRRRLVAIE